MNEQIGAQLTTSAAIVFFLQWLKKSKYFPWVTFETERLNHLLAAILSAVAAFGVHATYDKTTGTLLVVGLTGHAVISFIWSWAKQYFTAKVMYSLMIKQPILAAPLGEQHDTQHDTQPAATAAAPAAGN